MIEAILFDLDETLHSREEAFWRWIDEESRRLQSTNLDRAQIGRLDARGRGDKDALLAYLDQTFGWELPEAARFERFRVGIVEHLHLDGRTRDMLERLKKRYRLGLVTNGTSATQRRKLQKLGVESLFDAVTISEEVGFKKPDPRAFQHALQQLGTYLRNRVAHAGYEPSYEQVMLAQNAVVELERYVGALLTRQFKRWSLTCLSWTGTVGLAQRGIPAASVKMALQTNAEFDGWGTFDRWRQHFVRNRGGLQTPGSDPDQLQLLWVRTVDGKTHWFLADNATRMASSVDVNGVVSPEALDLIAKVQRALDESPPEVATRMDVRMPPGELAKLSATWSP